MLYHILFSPTGGTEKVADILGRCICKESTRLDLCDPGFAGAVLTAEDVAIISMPAYAGRVPCTATERMSKIEGNHARAILLCVYGNREYDNTLAEMKDQAERAGFRPIAAVAALAEHSMVRKIAAGRPDAEDRRVLETMAGSIRAKLEAYDCTPVCVPGVVPDKPIGNFGGNMAPAAGERCTNCGICAEKCPTQAIDRATLEADKGRCIGCMRCIAVCPAGAREQTVTIDRLGSTPVSELLSRRKENELFL